jgi:hypothetical protein
MIYIVTNAYTIFAATLAGLAFGVGYYFLVDRAAVKSSREGLTKLIVLAALAFVAEAWFASILAGALILAPPEAGRWTMAIGSALVIWIGFIVPVLLVTHRTRALSTRTALTDCAHWLGVIIIQALVLQAIGLQLPRA